MQTLEAITKRRSIRKFTGKALSQQHIETLLQAARLAPPARKAQGWDFSGVRDRAGLDKLMKAPPSANMLSTADCAIIVCGDTRRETAAGYWPGDCGAAAQNILLAATDMGLGSVWLGVYPTPERMEAVAKVLGLPEHVKPFNIIALGYPDEKKEDVDRFDPAKVHYEKW